jgi:dephospho-CoA kinase
MLNGLNREMSMATGRDECNASIESLRQNVAPFLLGVTGSVATGKTVVAGMFEELGARTIDFDVLSRLVVEPGRQAWKKIVDHFGEDVLLEDKTVDRRKLAEIVFQDEEKRKKLESFIHPRVGEEFVRLVAEYASEDPNAIVQAVVPLLFEVNMQSVFDKVLLVYAPEEMQIERLMKRDGISRDMAAIVLSSQWPIEKKRDHADFIVDNSASLDHTRQQVGETWEELKRVRQEHTA